MSFRVNTIMELNRFKVQKDSAYNWIKHPTVLLITAEKPWRIQGSNTRLKCAITLFSYYSGLIEKYLSLIESDHQKSIYTPDCVFFAIKFWRETVEHNKQLLLQTILIPFIEIPEIDLHPCSLKNPSVYAA